LWGVEVFFGEAKPKQAIPWMMVTGLVEGFIFRFRVRDLG